MEGEERGGLELAERLRTRAQTICPPSTAMPVTASFGVARYRGGESVADLVRRADDALYVAKASGRDAVRSAEATAQSDV